MVNLESYPVKGIQYLVDTAYEVEESGSVIALFRSQLYSLPDQSQRLLAKSTDYLVNQIRDRDKQIQQLKSQLEQHGGMGDK